MVANGIKQFVYKPRVVMAHYPVGSNPHPARIIFEYFTLPSGKGNSKLVLPIIERYLVGLSFEYEWVCQFVLSADEALSNACEYSSPGSSVRGILTIVECDRTSFVSLVIDNDTHLAEIKFPAEDSRVDFDDCLSAERGRGFGIMELLADGLVVTFVPELTIQTTIEWDHLPSVR